MSPNAEGAAPNTMSAPGESNNELFDMTVKEKRGRRRYVVFTVSAGLTKDALIGALRNVCGDPPYVVQCAGGWAVVRCSPADVDRVIEKMGLADASSVSLRTSGTLASLYGRYPDLKRSRPIRKT